MRKIKEVLRQDQECGLSDRQIAESCKIGRTTVQEYLARARVSKVAWDKARDMSDDELEKLLFPGNTRSANSQPVPDWQVIHIERKKPGVTLQLLWEEYRANHGDGYGYSRFCDLYHTYVSTIDVRMRQTHKAGDKLFIDYSGKKAEIIDSATGEILHAEIFVAVMGASNYTYIEATMSQSLQDWIGSHVRAFEFFHGTTALLVPDNLRSAISKACRYDPETNPTYAALAEHYGTAVLPARPYEPRDKAKVEGGVLLAQRWILARLRHQRFFSLSELNAAIRKQLESFNERPFKKLPGCRKTAFDEIDRLALRPLPSIPFEFADWKKATVGFDYHVEFDHHYYSAPYQRAHQKIQIRATAQVIEVFHKGERIASHVRSNERGKYTTLKEHMPPQHEFCKWTPGKFLNWALKLGKHILQVVRAVIESKPHPQQAFRACMGILQMGNQVGPERLDAACERALHYKSPRYGTVKNILENGQEYMPLPVSRQLPKLPAHRNIRGPAYFQLTLEGDDDATSTNH
jgi:transposase